MSVRTSVIDQSFDLLERHHGMRQRTAFAVNLALGVGLALVLVAINQHVFQTGRSDAIVIAGFTLVSHAVWCVRKYSDPDRAVNLALGVLFLVLTDLMLVLILMVARISP